MTERDVLYPYPLATRVDERIYSLIKSEAEKRHESESSTLRRILESWATFVVQEPRNASYRDNSGEVSK